MLDPVLSLLTDNAESLKIEVIQQDPLKVKMELVTQSFSGHWNSIFKSIC